MNIVSTIRRMLRGEVSAGTAALEAIRRVNSGLEQRHERRRAAQLNHRGARLTREFARMSAPDLLEHFRARQSPRFFPGFSDPMRTARLQRELFPNETEKLIAGARRIATEHRWPLLGFGERCFGAGEIDWHLDPLSGVDWPTSYHADIELFRNDGSDARVLWELNRLGHLITLGRAYSVTNDAAQADSELFAAEFFRQIASWRLQNPVTRGINWNCAMEAALRAINLLAAFTLFLPSERMTGDTLGELLMMFDQHGAHIRRNLEFSHIATSNHYLADVAGLLWLGLMLPELEEASAWREFGLRELLNEMDKQILGDGADSESSTGYHRLKAELFLYSFVLCHLNDVDIDQRYWQKLRAMIEYVRAYLRPDGCAPLIGDSDGGQVLPIVRRASGDHGYLLQLAAAVFQEARFGAQHAGRVRTTEEVLWILGEQGIRDYSALASSALAESSAFPDAGVYVTRHDDLYLLFNASDSGMRGRGSHGHNDALSIDVGVGKKAFIVDPGTYLYTANLSERNRFRSTAYHSTIEIDGAEQNETDERTPFVIGDEAHPRVLRWETNSETDLISAEHDGYSRLPQPVTHRRTVTFFKKDGWWLIEDELAGDGEHQMAVRFHFNSGLEVNCSGDAAVAREITSRTSLHVISLDLREGPQVEPQFTSRDYGSKEPTSTACWTVTARVPISLRWALVPVRANETESQRLDLIKSLRK